MIDLAHQQSELRVVDDRMGCPTYAPHLAEAILGVARAATAAPQKHIWGIYHGAGKGAATWGGFAREIVRLSGARGGPSVPVVPITTDQYPTPASRPVNSRLDSSKLAAVFGVALPPWQQGVAECMARLRE
jgi:dTDP-4-dehydrorhamnose reductase